MIKKRKKKLLMNGPNVSKMALSLIFLPGKQCNSAKNLKRFYVKCI